MKKKIAREIPVILGHHEGSILVPTSLIRATARRWFLLENKTMNVNRRKLGGGLLLATGVILFVIPFLLTPPIEPATTTPPPTSGSKHGGSSGGGTSPPRCVTNCQASKDTQPPLTTIQATGQLEWPRNSITYFYPNVTVTLHAVDDQNLTSITLNDNGSITNFAARSLSSSATLTLTTTGLHMLSYYATDKAGNRETAHKTTVGLNKPNLSDIQNVIMSSNIEVAGIKNALVAKVSAAEAQIAADQKPTALNHLSNQLNALDGKHELDQATVYLIEAMIASIGP
jgi:hypothetical protein